jgi:transcriptional regulator with XRE-family HTH domain
MLLGVKYPAMRALLLDAIGDRELIEIAAPLGVSTSTVSRWRSGDMSPSRVHWTALAEVLRIDVRQIAEAYLANSTPSSDADARGTADRNRARARRAAGNRDSAAVSPEQTRRDLEELAERVVELSADVVRHCGRIVELEERIEALETRRARRGAGAGGP